MSQHSTTGLAAGADNLRGAAIMVLAMLCFAIEDAIIKQLSAGIPLWLVFATLGGGSALIFALLLFRAGIPLLSRGYLLPAVLVRNLAEAIGAWGFVNALALIPLATASAFLQAAPILVALGAALFLKEPVGLRRWTAIVIGFLGVMLIIRPGTQGFDSNVIFAVIGVLGLAVRDLATRKVPAHVHAMQLSMLGFLSLLPVALFLWATESAEFQMPAVNDLTLLALTVPVGMIAYFAITVSGRIGEISFVTPFRYSRMLFALFIGFFIFAERADTLTLIGVTIVIASGLYTLWREQIRKTADAT